MTSSVGFVLPAFFFGLYSLRLHNEQIKLGKKTLNAILKGYISADKKISVVFRRVENRLSE